MPWTTPPGAGATVYFWNGYTLAERDRRWQAVRANAAKAGFDCILVPLGNGIDGRYMTQLRCSAMVLPADGRAPIVIADRRSSNDWVPDPGKRAGSGPSLWARRCSIWAWTERGSALSG